MHFSAIERLEGLAVGVLISDNIEARFVVQLFCHDRQLVHFTPIEHLELASRLGHPCQDVVAASPVADRVVDQSVFYFLRTSRVGNTEHPGLIIIPCDQTVLDDEPAGSTTERFQFLAIIDLKGASHFEAEQVVRSKRQCGNVALYRLDLAALVHPEVPVRALVDEIVPTEGHCLRWKGFEFTEDAAIEHVHVLAVVDERGQILSLEARYY